MNGRVVVCGRREGGREERVVVVERWKGEEEVGVWRGAAGGKEVVCCVSGYLGGRRRRTD